MTIHEALWFIEQVNQFHPENAQHPKRRFTRRCLYDNVHPNQEAFMTLEGSVMKEGEFAKYVSILKKRNCIGLIDRGMIPQDCWVSITNSGKETLKLFHQQCPNHHFDGNEKWSRRPADQRCALRASPNQPKLTLSCYCQL
jgi:hypothetical protein